MPKSITAAIGAAEYFDVEARGGQIILTPVRIRRGDALRAKLAELDLGEADVVAHCLANRPLRAAGVAGDCSRADPCSGLPEVQAVGRRREELLADYLPHCRSVRIPARLPKLAQCRDANDQMFIELVAVGKAWRLLLTTKNASFEGAVQDGNCSCRWSPKKAAVLNPSQANEFLARQFANVRRH